MKPSLFLSILDSSHGRSTRRARLRFLSPVLVGLFCLLCPPWLTQATESNLITKANNENPLNQRESWTGMASLNGSEIALWDATVSTANTSKIGGAIGLLGIRVLDPGGPVEIMGDSSGTGSATLTLGWEGIDLGKATQDLTINGPIRLGSSQRWEIAGGRNLRIGESTQIDLGSHLLVVGGAGTSSFAGGITGSGSLLLRFSSPESVFKFTASGHNGATILQGGILLLEGDGVLEGTSQLILAKGRLEFEGTFLQIADEVQVNLMGGDNDGTVILMKHLGEPSQLTMGSISVRSGEAEFEFVGKAPEKLLTVDSLARDPNLRGTIILGGGVSDQTFDGEFSRFVVKNPPPLIGGELETPMAGILPWVTTGRQLITYDPGTGFRTLKEGEFVIELSDEAQGKNVVVSTPQVLGGDLAINSFCSNNQAHDLGGHTLTIASGAVYENTGSSMGLRNGVIDFGTQEGVLSGHIVFEKTLKIKGTGGLTLMDTFRNQGKVLACPENEFTGGVWVQDGTLATGADSETIPDVNAVFLARPASLIISSTSGEPIVETIASLAGEGIAKVGNGGMLKIGRGDDAQEPNSIKLCNGGTLSPGNNSGSSDILPGSLKLATPEGGTISLADGTLLLDITSPFLHDKLEAEGTVTLGNTSEQGTTLTVQTGYPPKPGDVFLILSNDGNDPIEGKFSNGNQVQATFQGQPAVFEILYNTNEAGGDGNDIALRFGQAASGSQPN